MTKILSPTHTQTNSIVAYSSFKPDYDKLQRRTKQSIKAEEHSKMGCLQAIEGLLFLVIIDNMKALNILLDFLVCIDMNRVLYAKENSHLDRLDLF